MNQKLIVIERSNFLGGVNQGEDPALIKEHQLADARNWIIDTTGILTKRAGRSVYASSGTLAPCKGLYRFYKSDTGDKYLIAVYGDTVYKVDEGAGTMSSLVGSWTTTFDTRFATWQNLCFFANGSDALTKWDGTSVSNVANAPAAMHLLAVHNGRLFGAQGTTLYYCALMEDADAGLENYEIWSGDDAGFLEISKADGEDITGLVSQAGGLLILKENSLSYLYGATETEEWVVRKEVQGIGAVSFNSVASGMGRTFFVGRDGVYMEQGQQVYKISRTIQPLLDALTRSELGNTVGAYHQGKYYLSIPANTGEANSLLLAFDIERSIQEGDPVWEIHGVIGGNAMISLTGPDDNGYFLVGSAASDGKLFNTFDGTADESSNIEAYLETGQLMRNQSRTWFNFDHLWVTADFPENGTLTVDWTAFKNGDATTTGSFNMSKSGRKRLPPNCQGRDLQLKFTVNDQNSWRFREYTVEAVPKRLNRV